MEEMNLLQNEINVCEMMIRDIKESGDQFDELRDLEEILNNKKYQLLMLEIQDGDL